MSDSQRRSGSQAQPPTKESKESKEPKPARPAAAAAHPARLFSVPSLQRLLAANLATDYVADYVKTHKQVNRSALRKHLGKDALTQTEPVTQEILKEFEVWLAKKKFREYILQNKLIEAEAILRVHEGNTRVLQDLLFERGTIANKDATQDRFGARWQHLRILEGSAFQLMIWSHNVGAVLKMMGPFIKRVDPDRRLAREQFAQQLPQFSALLAPKTMASKEGKDAKSESTMDEQVNREINIDKIYTLFPTYSLDLLAQAIAADPCKEEKAIQARTSAELEKFEAYLHPRPPAVISQGCYANFPLFHRAFVYLNDNWNHAHQNIFWNRVVLPLIETFPAGFASRLNYTGIRTPEDDFDHIPGTLQKFQCLKIWANANALYHEKPMELRQLIDWLQNPDKELEVRPAFLGSRKC